MAGDILINMNKNGNPGSLVAAHPGNANAAKHGVYSPRATEPRAAEIVAELLRSFDFSVTQRIALVEFARSTAILELIDLDLMERGIVDKRGEPRSMLNHRSRIVRQLDHWLSKIAPAMERQAANESLSSSPGRPEYIRELQRIALGHDSTASARDRVTALKELVEIGSAPSEVMVVEFNVPKDRLPRQVGEKPRDEPGGDDVNEIEG